ncbi:hypothetical protein Tco_0366874 [Tanacetum coccineum]
MKVHLDNGYNSKITSNLVNKIFHLDILKVKKIESNDKYLDGTHDDENEEIENAIFEIQICNYQMEVF